ncbi:MAG: hypothetical protein ACXWJD_05665 [Burkholderiaceae bacterium]
MAYPKNNRRKYGVCIWVALQLMCFALFLHPMNPEDFLLLVITDPLQTFSDQYGSEMAFAFWIGLSLFLVGLFGWLNIVHLFKNLLRTKVHSFKIRHAR